MALDYIYINGGKRGFIVKISPDALKLLDYELVSVAI
jgi:prolyl-tRNA editing enzyme YbaK/EbsC (Cys-tRNA(Pro) deacylase)